MVELKTWGGGSSFKYEVLGDEIAIIFGQHRRKRIPTDQYKHLLHHFAGKRVKVGASRDKALPGSLGRWILDNLTQAAVASYLASILVAEGHATRVKHYDDLIQF